MPVLEIGARLGCGKNAVCGKVKRMGLTPRPDPIKSATPIDRRASAAKRVAKQKAKRVAFEARKAATAVDGAQRMATEAQNTDGHLRAHGISGAFIFDGAILRRAVADYVAPAKTKFEPKPLPASAPSNFSGRGCHWLYGKRGSYRTCNATRVEHKPYCEAHMDIAYEKRKTS